MIVRINEYYGKDVFFGTGTIPQLCKNVQTLKPYFVCALFLNQYDWTEDDLKALIQQLINCGAAYLLFHGDRCKRAHVLADQVQTEIIPEITNENVIGTRWEERTSEEEVVFSAFVASMPADDYLDKFSSYLVIALGTASETDHVRALSENLEVTIEVGGCRLDAEDNSGQTH